MKNVLNIAQRIIINDFLILFFNTNKYQQMGVA